MKTLTKMDISVYIIDLLYIHNCVIIPDFGAFVASYEPADLNKKTNTFTPPNKKLAFNDNLKEDDNLLSDYLAEIKKISKTEAKNIVKNFVDQIKEKLQKENRVYFKDLGYCYIGKDKKTLFEPHITTNLLPDSFGLPIFEFPTTKKQSAPLPNSDKKSGRQTNNVYIRWSIIGASLPVIAAIILLSITTDYFKDFRIHNVKFNSSIKEKRTAIIKKSRKQKKNKTSKTSIEKQLDEQTDKIKALSYQEIKTQSNNQLEQISEYSKFFLIAGSFTSYDNALKLYNELTKLGYDAEIIAQDNQPYRVSYKSFTNKQLAIKELNKIRADRNNQSIWILSM